MVYAVGRPTNGSMKVITHTLELTPNGALVPRSVKTGSAGLAADIRTTPFATPLTSVAPEPCTWLFPVFLRLLQCGAGAPR